VNEENLIGREMGGCRLESLLGRGRLGDVYLALQESLGKAVAVKVFSPAVSAREDYTARLVRDVEKTAELLHPHVVQLFGTGVRHDRRYVIAEYVDGARTLREMVEEKGGIGPRDAVEVLAQIVSALERCAAAGVFHGDLRPETVLLRADGSVKLSDVGYAKWTPEAHALLSAGVRVGDPAFAAPEWLEGGEGGLRADVYSCGRLAWYLAEGSIPPEPGNPLPSTGDSRFDAVVARCTAPVPAERFSSYAELREALESGKEAAEVSTPGFPRSRPGPAGAEEGGKYTCPRCGRRFDGEPDFFSRLACPACGFSFEADEKAGGETGTFFREEAAVSLAEAALAGGADERVLPPRVEEEAVPEEETLASLMKRAIVMPPREAFSLAARLVEERIRAGTSPSGVIAPDEVTLRRDGSVEFSDIRRDPAALTAKEAPFAAPEVWRGEEPDESSDVYALGMLLAYMLSGESPAPEGDREAARKFHEEGGEEFAVRFHPDVTDTGMRLVRMMCRREGEECISSLRELHELLVNEAKRMDGTPVEDRVTAARAPRSTEPQEEERKREEEEAVRREAPRGPLPPEKSLVACTTCGRWNMPETFVCEGCGKLLREENPDRAPRTEEEYVALSELLYMRGDYRAALEVCREGIGKFFASGKLKETELRLTERLEAGAVEEIEKRGAELLLRGRYKDAIREWEKAAALSPEAGVRLREKIALARADLRKARVRKLLFAAASLAGAVVLLCALFPGRAAALLSPWCRRAGIRIGWIERYRPKGLEGVSVDGSTPPAELMKYVRRGKGKALSPAQEQVFRAACRELAARCRARVSGDLSGKNLGFLEECASLLEGTPAEGDMRRLKEETVGRLFGEGARIAARDPREGAAVLEALLPYARGTAVEKRIREALQRITAGKNVEGKETKGAVSPGGDEDAVLRSARAREERGDLEGALAAYKRVLARGEGRARRAAEAGIARITAYLREARRLAAEVESAAAHDRQRAFALYRELVKRYSRYPGLARVRLPLKILTVPPGARVAMNGRVLGTTPVEVYCSPREKSVLECTREGYLSRRCSPADVPVPARGAWKIELLLCRAPDIVLDANDRVEGVCVMGDMAYTAGTRGVVAFFPFDEERRVRVYPYPPGRDEDPGRRLRLVRAEGFESYVLKNRTLMVFNPITERVSACGTLPETPASPLLVTTLFPGKEKALFYWTEAGALRGRRLPGFKGLWRRRFVERAAGAGICAYKRWIVTGHPGGDKVIFISKEDGGVEKVFSLPGRKYRFTRVEHEIFACSERGAVMRLNMMKENPEEWRMDTRVAVSAPVVAGRVWFFVLSAGGECIAGYRRNGEIMWRRRISSRPLKGGVFFKNKVYIYDSSGIIYEVDVHGTVVERLYGRADIASEIVVCNGRLLFVTEKGRCMVYTR